MVGEAPDMEFINNQVAHGTGGLGHVPPVEHIPYDTGVVTAGFYAAPEPLACHRAGIWIQQNGVAVESQTVFRFIGAVDLIGVFKFFNIQAEYDHGIDIPDFVGFRKGKAGIGGMGVSMEEKERAGSAVMGVDGEIDTNGEHHGSVYIEKARTDQKTFYLGCGHQ